MGRNKKRNTDKLRNNTTNIEEPVTIEANHLCQTYAGDTPVSQPEDKIELSNPQVENDCVVEEFDLVEEINGIEVVSPPSVEARQVNSETQHPSPSGGRSAKRQRSGDRLSSGISSDDSVDILGNSSVLKTVIHKGLGLETRPNHGDLITIEYKGWLEDGTLVDDVSNFSFSLGDGDVIHAFDLALPLAELNETFEMITESRFAYSSLGREPDIPGDAKLRYVINLISVDDPPNYSRMSTTERLTAADRKRERGNFYYRRDEYAFAVNSYNKAVHILTTPYGDDCEQVSDQETDDSSSAYDLKMKLYNNLAATQIKIEAFDAAIKSCDAVLLHDPSNFKALYRKGKALLGLGDTDNAIEVLQQVLEQVPSSRLVLAELKRARLMMQRERERWSRAAARLLHERDPINRQGQTSYGKRKWRLCSPSWSCITLTTLFVVLVSVMINWWFPDFVNSAKDQLTRLWISEK